jgi:CpeT/CpcT family (DUF1001)
MTSKSAIVFTTVMLVTICWGCMPCKHMPCDMMKSTDLALLASWMTGAFSSEIQSGEDPEYFPITLHMSRIWVDRRDGYWLYVEQAVAGRDPYRQRVYQVTEPAPGLFQSAVYSMKDPLRFTGACEDPSLINELTPELLIPRQGCELILRKSGDTFTGNTLGRMCESKLGEAMYATSEVYITESRLTSWDRGFDAANQQAWGAVKGPYIFDKLTDYPL